MERGSEGPGILLASDVDADNEYGFVVEVTIPEELDPGAYVVRTSGIFAEDRIKVRRS